MKRIAHTPHKSIHKHTDKDAPQTHSRAQHTSDTHKDATRVSNDLHSVFEKVLTLRKDNASKTEMCVVCDAVVEKGGDEVTCDDVLAWREASRQISPQCHLNVRGPNTGLPRDLKATEDQEKKHSPSRKPR